MCTTSLQQARSSSVCRFGCWALLICSLALTACGDGTNTEEEKILIKFPHVTAPGTPKGKAADRFRDLVHERLGDRVTVEVYPSGQLMNDDDSIDALAFGEVQMIAVSLSKFDRLTKKYQIFDLPFMFNNIEAVERFQSSPSGAALLTAMTDNGLTGLGFWHNGMKQFSGPEPMTTPAAAKGLKFRIMESDVLQAQILQVGGNPQKMALGEVYQALQTGAVDAQENTWSNIYSAKFYEVQPHITQSNHGYIGYLVLVNSGFWSSIPDDIRSELQSIMDETSAWANAQSTAINLDALEKIKASERSNVVTLTPEQIEEWRVAMRPVWTQFEEAIGSDIIEAAQQSSQ
jgi:C4-dicarboxylate-binding protein DctP